MPSPLAMLGFGRSATDNRSRGRSWFPKKEAKAKSKGRQFWIKTKHDASSHHTAACETFAAGRSIEFLVLQSNMFPPAAPSNLTDFDFEESLLLCASTMKARIGRHLRVWRHRSATLSPTKSFLTSHNRHELNVDHRRRSV